MKPYAVRFFELKKTPGNSKLYDTVFEAFFQTIIEGKTTAGERIIVSKVSKELGISMTPIRSAIEKLARLNLVKIQQNKSAVVSNFSKKDIAMFYYYRSTLEMLAAYQACMRMTDDDFNTMERLLHELEKLYVESEQDDILRDTAVTQADFAFHQFMVECARNPYLSACYKDILGFSCHVRNYLNRSPKSRLSFVQEHTMIFLALKQGNPELAKNAIETHLVDGNHSLLELS